jgi:hypothetical protein
MLTTTRFEFAGPPGPAHPHVVELVGTTRSPFFTARPRTSLTLAVVSSEQASEGEAANARFGTHEKTTSTADLRKAFAKFHFIAQPPVWSFRASYYPEFPGRVPGTDLEFRRASSFLSVLEAVAWGSRVAAVIETVNECEAGNSPPDTGGVAAPSRKRCEATLINAAAIALALRERPRRGGWDFRNLFEITNHPVCAAKERNLFV